MTGHPTTDDHGELFVRLRDAPIAYWQTLGMALERADAVGHVVMSMGMRPDLGGRRPEVMHGGAIASLIDCAAGAAVLSLRVEGDESWGGQATLDMNVSYLNAAQDEVVAEATVLRQSRRLAFVGVDVRDRAGTLMAVGRATYTIVRR